MNIEEIIRKNINKVVREATDRDASVGSYFLDNSQSLEAFLHDPNKGIKQNVFVSILYVSEMKLNKTFRKKGFTDSNGVTMTGQDLEDAGRALGAKLKRSYLNNFFDDNFDVNTSRKINRNFGAFMTTQQTIQWGLEKYGESLNQISNVINDASKEDLEYFTYRDPQTGEFNDPDFGKRVKKYVEEHPEEKDVVNAHAENNLFAIDRDLVNKIMATRLTKSVQPWIRDVRDTKNLLWKDSEGDDANYAIRITKSHKFRPKYNSYAVDQNGQMSKISKEEYSYLMTAFGGGKKAVTDPNDVEQSAENVLRQQINDIKSRNEFRNFLIPQIAQLTFTAYDTQTNEPVGKPVTYTNPEIRIGDMVIDTYQLLRLNADDNDSLMAESRKRRIIIRESDIRNLVRQMIQERRF